MIYIKFIGSDEFQDHCQMKINSEHVEINIGIKMEQSKTH